MRFTISSFTLLVSLFFTFNTYASADEKELYYFLKKRILSENHTNWTDIFYAGSNNLKNAHEVCMQVQTEGEEVDFADDLIQGYGYECVVGYYTDKNGAPKSEDFGAPLVSCATVAGTNVETAMHLNANNIWNKKVSKETASKFNSLYLGFAIHEMTDALKFYQVPEDKYQRALNKLEKKLVKRLKRQPRRFLSSTYSQMNKFAKRVNKKTGDKYKLRPIMGCGGGIFPVQVKTIPENANLEIIPKMFYDFCLAKNISIDSPECKKHFIPNIKDKEEIYLSGVYMYRLVINGTKSEFRYKDTSRDIIPAIKKLQTAVSKLISLAANASDEVYDDDEASFIVVFE